MRALDSMKTQELTRSYTLENYKRYFDHYKKN